MKQKPKKDYQMAPVRMPPDVKKRVRLLAAEKDTCMADMARELIVMGLAVYEENQKAKRRKPA